MNQNTATILARAQTEVNTLYDAMETEPEGDFIDWYQAQIIEKFTELMVKECCLVMSATAKRAQDQYTYMGDDVPTSVHQWNLKKHFGVEK